MRRSIMILIGVWSLIGIILVGVMIAGVSFYGVSRQSQANIASDAVVDETVSMDGIKTIRLNMAAAKVSVRHSSDRFFRVLQTVKNIDESFTLKVENTGSSIVVGPKGRFSLNIFNLGRLAGSENTVEIFVPGEYEGAMHINLSSGSLDINDPFSLESVNFHVSAGSLAGRSSLKAEKSDLHVSAGNLALSGLSSANFDISTSAGKINIEELSGSGNASVSAGSIDVGSLSLEDSLTLHTSAGSIKIGLKGDPALDYKLRTSAGSINTYFAGSVSGGGGKSSGKTGAVNCKLIDASTSAGSINILQA